MTGDGRFDERDTMFARMAWGEGSEARKDYYSRNPRKKPIDDELRAMPELGIPESPAWNPLASAVIDGVFRLLSDWHPLVEREPHDPSWEQPPETCSRWVVGMAKHFGADLASTLRMHPVHYYSHRGRREESYGDPVTDFLPWGVAIAVSMDRSMVHGAPLAAQTVGTVRGYLSAAVSSLALAYAIQSAGFRARVHMDGNYLVAATRVAVDAGLGARGLHGLLITRPFGPCVRIGVVTTDMPLTESVPDPAGGPLRDFCSACGRCAGMCPAGAIGNFKDEEGTLSFNPEACFRIWKTIGTDCGVCISACPFTEGLVDWEIFTSTGSPSEYARELVGRLPGRPFSPEPPDWLKPL